MSDAASAPLGRPVAGFAMLRALGFAAAVGSTLLLSYHFGQNRGTDAYFAALFLPYIVFNLVLGTVQPSIVTLLSRLQAEGRSDSAGRFMHRILAISAASGIVLSAAAWALGDVWIAAIAPDLPPEGRARAGDFMTWMAPTVFPAVVLPVLLGILQAHHSFTLTPLFPLLLQIPLLATLLLRGSSEGWMPVVVATPVGFVLATLIMGMAVLPILRRPAGQAGIGTELLESGRVSLWLGITQILYLVQLFVTRHLASDLPGAITALTYAERVLNPPSELIGSSLSAVLLPTLVALEARHRSAESGEKTVQAVAMAWFLLVPCAAFFALFSTEIVRLLFERGSFGVEETGVTATLLTVYALVLPATMSQVLFRLFLAKRKVLGKVLLLLAITLLYVPLSFLAADRFGLRGIVSAVVITHFLYFGTLLTFLLRETNGSIRRRFAQSVAMTVALTGFAVAGVRALQTALPENTTTRTTAALAFAVLYLGPGLMLKRPELRSLLRTLPHRRGQTA